MWQVPVQQVLPSLWAGCLHLLAQAAWLEAPSLVNAHGRSESSSRASVPW